MKANVKKDLCIGCGLCADLYPTVFYMNGDDVAEAFGEELSGDLLEVVEEAKEQCPNEAIVTVQ
jgi:ferredoxin